MRLLGLSVVTVALAFGASVRATEPIPPSSIQLPELTAHVVSVTPGAPAEDDAIRRFRETFGSSWQVYRDHRASRPARIQGAGMPLFAGRGNSLEPSTAPIDLATLELLARELIAHPAIAPLLQPSLGELRVDRRHSAIRGNLASIYFDWYVDGVQVEQASVFVRVNSGNVTQLGAPYVVERVPDATPAISESEALDKVLEHAGHVGTELRDLESRLLFQVEDLPPDGVRLRLVWRHSYRLPGRVETWEGRVDARSGDLVGFRDLTVSELAVGGVFERTNFGAGEKQLPMPSLSVVVDGEGTVADSSGKFQGAGRPTSSSLRGRYFTTMACNDCSSPDVPLAESPIGTGRIDFGFGGETPVGNGTSTPGARSAYYHMNQVRRIGEKWLPHNTWFQEGLLIFADQAGACDAFWNGAGAVFLREGAGCANTAEISDVAYHEWGHGIDDATGGGDIGAGEGKADIVAMLMTRTAALGPGFFSATGEPVRDLNSTTSPRGVLTRTNAVNICPPGPGPLGLEHHCEGEILGQTIWDLTQMLIAKYGVHTGWRESERLFYTSLPDASGYLPTDAMPVYDAYLMADDDDGNLANGTPNAAEIFAAFELHELANAPIPATTPCSRPATPTVTPTPQCDRIGLSWSETPGASYHVLRAETTLTGPLYLLAELPPGTTSFEDLEVAPGIDYGYSVLAIDGNGCESSVAAPVTTAATPQPGLSLSARIVDDEPAGNRSGFADPGEQVDLTLTLANVGQENATGISGNLSSATPGVTILDGADVWPAIAADGEAVQLGVLRFETDDQQVACGERLGFQLLPDEGSVCDMAPSGFEVTLGQRVPVVFDDFETDQGWTLGTSTATEGTWVLNAPTGTTHQASGDVTEGGTDCWFTNANGLNADAGDVDGGLTTLLSPLFDLSGLARAEVSYHRWYANGDVGTDPDDYFRVDVSPDAGSSWFNLETLDHTKTAPAWARRAFTLEGPMLTTETRFRVVVSDGTLTDGTIEAAIDDFAIDRFVCDSAPACATPPSFAGLAAVTTGSACGEIDLFWTAATSNCVDADIRYDIHRSTDPGFVPGPSNRIAGGVVGTAFTDSLLVPGEVYSYVVRAVDSRSGADANTVRVDGTASNAADITAPVFGGLLTAESGPACGEAVLSWTPALESCSVPVTYEVHVSDQPGFVPGPATLIATTFSTSFVDSAQRLALDHEYVVRARDAAGNEDTNVVRLTARATVLDRYFALHDFEADDGAWQVTAPNDATVGEWEWGDPEPAAAQSGEDATPGGSNAWITELDTWNVDAFYDWNDVDGGTTTLVSAVYDVSEGVQPNVRYSRWYAGVNGQDSFTVDVSSDGGSNWTLLEDVSPTGGSWSEVELPLNGGPLTNQMRFRFTVADLGADTAVEAGIDEFAVVEHDGGCSVCDDVPDTVGTILLSKSGDDVIVDWTADPAGGQRFKVYRHDGATFVPGPVVGSTDTRSFVHQQALASGESFFYRVSSVDECGEEGPLN